MSHSKALERLATIAQRFAMLDRTNPVRIETYPHREDEGEGFKEGETCFEVSIDIRGSHVSAVAKTLDAAADAAAEKASGLMRRMADQARSERDSSAKEALDLDEWAGSLRCRT